MNKHSVSPVYCSFLLPASCLACGKFIQCFPEECHQFMEELFPLFVGNLEDSIPSIRQGAAAAIASVVTAYGEYWLHCTLSTTSYMYLPMDTIIISVKILPILCQLSVCSTPVHAKYYYTRTCTGGYCSLLFILIVHFACMDMNRANRANYLSLQLWQYNET